MRWVFFLFRRITQLFFLFRRITELMIEIEGKKIGRIFDPDEEIIKLLKLMEEKYEKYYL
jgi:transposase